MPEFVTLHLPCIQCAPDNENFATVKCDDIAMNCLLTTQRVRTVFVECVPEVLEYVRCAIMQAAFEDRLMREKRCTASITGVVGVRCDKRRKTVYAMVKADTPAGKRRVQKKPSEWSETFISQSARELLEEIQQQGLLFAYKDGCDDDEGLSPEKGEDGDMELDADEGDDTNEAATDESPDAAPSAKLPHADSL